MKYKEFIENQFNYGYCCILAVPEFTEEPDNKVMGVEEDVTFTCKARGRPRPDIEWSINGVPAQCKSLI